MIWNYLAYLVLIWVLHVNEYDSPLNSLLLLNSNLDNGLLDNFRLTYIIL